MRKIDTAVIDQKGSSCKIAMVGLGGGPMSLSFDASTTNNAKILQYSFVSKLLSFIPLDYSNG